IARRDAAFQQVPVDLGPRPAAAAPNRHVRLVGVAQDLEPHELVDILGGQRGLVKLHPKLLHPDGRNVDHGDVVALKERRERESRTPSSSKGAALYRPVTGISTGIENYAKADGTHRQRPGAGLCAQLVDFKYLAAE